MDTKRIETTITLSTFTMDEEKNIQFCRKNFYLTDDGYEEKMGNFITNCIKNRGFILPYCFEFRGVSFYPTQKAKEIMTEFRKNFLKEEYESIGEGENYSFVEYKKDSPKATEELKESIKKHEKEIVEAVSGSFKKFEYLLAEFIYSIVIE